MAEVEHYSDVVSLGLAGDADGVAEAVDVKTGVRIEYNFHAVWLGSVGDFLHERNGLLVVVGTFVALYVQLEEGIASLEIRQGLRDGRAVAVAVGAEATANVKTVEF